MCLFFFFFQAEDGIRDYKVTGVQTCALPISRHNHQSTTPGTEFWYWLFPDSKVAGGVVAAPVKDPFLLLCLAFNKFALTHWTERAGFIYKRATIPALRKT